MLSYALALIRAMEAFGWYKSVFASVAIVIALLVLGLFSLKYAQPFLAQVQYEKVKLEDSKISFKSVETKEVSKTMTNNTSIKTDDINVTNNSSPTQINVGSPNAIQIVNQQRTILPDARIEKGVVDGTFVTRLILQQTSGIWDQGVNFQVGVKTTGSYESARIIRGFPPAQMSVRINENKRDGIYYYATSTAPIKDEPIVLEIKSATEIAVEQFTVSPMAGK